MAPKQPPPEDDLDQTILIPNPAGKKPAAAPPPSGTPQYSDAVVGQTTPSGPSTRLPSSAADPTGASQRAANAPVAMPMPIGRNPLLRAAATVFALVRGLHGVPQHRDIAGLHRASLQALIEFEKEAQASGVPPQTAFTGRYVLSALIDETVLSTPWGSESQWGNESLLATLHKETWAGEKFFQMVQNLSRDPRSNIDILELLYACLLHGYQGKYRVLERGSEQLERVKHGLYETIRATRGEVERDLSPRWQGLAARRPRISRVVPVWVAPVIATALVMLAFFYFNHRLNSVSDPTFARLNGLSNSLTVAQLRSPELPEPVAEPAAVQAPETLAMRLREMLKPEIDAGLIEVTDFGTATRVTLINQGSALFPSGSAIPGDGFLQPLRKIALLLNEYPVPIEVTGHTDNVQPRSGSNFKLSNARANAVRDVMAVAIDDTSRIIAEGRADTEPIADNATAAGRAKNRRVEIQVPVGYQTWALTAEQTATSQK